MNWRKGDTLLQLPDVMPAMIDCDNIVLNTVKQTELSNAWKVMDSRKYAGARWNVDGDTLSWECPFIYLIGGFSTDSKLYDTIWRGALNRLQGAPII